MNFWCKPGLSLGCCSSFPRTAQRCKSYICAQLRKLSPFAIWAIAAVPQRNRLCVSDIHSTGRESGDRQVKSGNKQEESRGIFSSCTPSLSNNMNCEMLQELAQTLCGWAPWAGRLSLSPGLCHQLLAGLWRCSGFASEGPHKRRCEDGCSSCHCLMQPHAVGKEKTDKPQIGSGCFQEQMWHCNC